MITAHYFHNLSPFIFKITETVGPRWYGLAYVLGFVLGFFLLFHLAKRGLSVLQPKDVGDFITYAAIFGVMLGGRIGYMLFYNFDELVQNPISFFNFLGGGMSSHGGILGLIIYTFIYSRIKKVSWTGLGDSLVVVAPIGLFFGRVANFINGELYGHISKISWAVHFPAELRDAPPETYSQALSIAHGIDNTVTHENFFEKVTANESIQNALRDVVNTRHPSQLYEAFSEGLLLFIVLITVRLRFPNLRHGILTGLFFILYAIARIICEIYRVPDSELIMGISKGQFYSVFMIVIGIVFLCFGGKFSSSKKA